MISTRLSSLRNKLLGGFFRLEVESMLHFILCARSSKISTNRSFGKCFSCAISCIRSNRPLEIENPNVSTAHPKGGSSGRAIALERIRTTDLLPHSCDASVDISKSKFPYTPVVFKDKPIKERGPMDDIVFFN